MNLRPLLLVALVLAGTTWSRAQGTAPARTLTVEDYDETIVDNQRRFLQEGKSCRIHYRGGPLVRLEAVYRPGSEVEEKEDLGPAPGDRTYTWTPKHAGLAMLRAVYDSGEKDAGGKPIEAAVEKPVSVIFASTITIGVFVMVIAAVLLFGGAFLSIRALLRDK